jgi:hypothetical protein
MRKTSEQTSTLELINKGVSIHEIIEWARSDTARTVVDLREWKGAPTFHLNKETER